MSNLTDELELQLDRVIEDRVTYYSSKESARQWITQDFAEWLVEKFVKESYNGK